LKNVGEVIRLYNDNNILEQVILHLQPVTSNTSVRFFIYWFIYLPFLFVRLRFKMYCFLRILLCDSCT